MNNGLYNGLENGLHNGVANGIEDGLKNGSFGNSISNRNDVDLFRYLEKSNVNNTLEIIAVAQLIFALKSNNLWDKVHAVYPFLGASKSSCKWNLKSENHNIDFFGTWIYDNKGVFADGSTAGGNINLIPATTLTIRDYSLGVYINGGTLEGVYGYPNTFGCSEDSTGGQFSNSLILRTSSKYFFPNGSGYGYNTVSNSSLDGFFIGNVKGNTTYLYRDGVLLNSNTTSGGGLYNRSLYIACVNLAGVAYYHQNVRFGIATVTKGLTVSEVTILNNIVNQFKITLNR